MHTREAGPSLRERNHCEHGARANGVVCLERKGILPLVRLSVGMLCAALICAVHLIAPPVAAAYYSGVLSGGDTEDPVYFTGNFSAGTYALGVRATGDGTNKLTIKVQKKATVGWSSIVTSSIDLGATDGCGYAELQFTLASSTEIRFHFSRKIGTQEIDYDWDTDFLVFWGGASFRGLTC